MGDREMEHMLRDYDKFYVEKQEALNEKRPRGLPK